MEQKVIKLRPHHLLCALTFRGKGYNLAFIQNMERVIKKLKRSSFPAILSLKGDVICSACPHNKNDFCFKRKGSEKKVRNHDLRVVKKFGLKLEEKIWTNRVWQNIMEKITPKDIPKLCQGCEWVKLCSKIKSF